MNPLLLGLAIYSAFMLVLGWRALRLNRTLDSYLIADRKLGPWVASFSERASGESAWLLIGLPGLAFAVGLPAVWVGVGCVGGIAFSWLAIARRLRTETERHGAITLADYFEARHGDQSHLLRIAATAIVLFFFTFYVAAQFLAAGKVLNFYLGIAPWQGMLIGAFLVLVYTVAGGLFAVAWTDLVQGLLMLLTLAVLPIAVLVELGGIAGLREGLLAGGAHLLAANPPGTSLLAEAGALGSMAIGLGYMGQPHLVLRFMAISSPDAVRKGRIIAVSWAVIAFAGAIMIGLAGMAYFGAGAIGPEGAIADKEQLMPLVARTFMPEWLAVVMILGAIAAMMSTADSQLLATSSAVSEDIYRRLLRPRAGPERLLLVGRLATVGMGLIALLLAWRVDEFVYSLVLYAWAGLGAAFGPPLLLSLWWNGTSRQGVLAGFVTGTVVVIVWHSVPALLGLAYEMIPGFLASLAATWGVSRLRPPAAGEGLAGRSER